MADEGNVNGDVIDDPDPNSAVVGVDIVSGDGNEPDPDPEPEPEPEPEAVPFDPGDHTVAEVEEYLAAHPDERAAVLQAEAAGKNRSSLVGSADAEQ